MVSVRLLASQLAKHLAQWQTSLAKTNKQLRGNKIAERQFYFYEKIVDNNTYIYFWRDSINDT